MPIRGATLRHRVQLQSRSTTQESTYGSQNATWTTYAQPYASIEPINGREMLSAQAVQTQLTHTITIYWNPSFTVQAADRIVFGTRIFDIQSAYNEAEDNRLIVMRCIEGTTQG